MKTEQSLKKIFPSCLGIFTFFFYPGIVLGASSKGMFSLNNTDFVVLISFVFFISILIYFGVPGLITKFLDQRAENIKSEIDKASELLEEAKTLLSSVEDKHKETALSIEQMIINAKGKVKFEQEKSKKQIEELVKNRLLSANEQIESAERKIILDIKQKAIDLGFVMARKHLEKNMSEENHKLYYDQSIKMIKTGLSEIKQ